MRDPGLHTGLRSLDIRSRDDPHHESFVSPSVRIVPSWAADPGAWPARYGGLEAVPLDQPPDVLLGSPDAAGGGELVQALPSPLLWNGNSARMRQGPDR